MFTLADSSEWVNMKKPLAVWRHVEKGCFFGGDYSISDSMVNPFNPGMDDWRTGEELPFQASEERNANITLITNLWNAIAVTFRNANGITNG